MIAHDQLATKIGRPSLAPEAIVISSSGEREKEREREREREREQANEQEKTSLAPRVIMPPG